MCFKNMNSYVSETTGNADLCAENKWKVSISTVDDERGPRSVANCHWQLWRYLMDSVESASAKVTQK